MKNIILFILLIILVIIYYKNYFSIKEDFKGISSVSEMMKQGEPAFDVPVASIITLNNTLQSMSGKKNDKEIEGFTGDSGISCNKLYTPLLKKTDTETDSSYNHFKNLYTDEIDEEKKPEGPDPKKKRKYLSGMIEESILLGCSGECTINIQEGDGDKCIKRKKLDENKIKERIIEYKKKIRDLWNGAEDEKVEEGSRWEDWNIYLSNNHADNPNSDNEYTTSETYGTMPYKGLKPEVETSWYDFF